MAVGERAAAAAHSATRRCASCRCDFRARRQHSITPLPPRPLVAVIVPFREQKQQDRRKQLDAFEGHMATFLRGHRFVVLVVQQSDDGRAFNRGALLNVGFREAQSYAEGLNTMLASVIFHDVDLLPSPGLLQWYLAPPTAGKPTHLAAPSTWGKYAMPGYVRSAWTRIPVFPPPSERPRSTLSCSHTRRRSSLEV